MTPYQLDILLHYYPTDEEPTVATKHSLDWIEDCHVLERLNLLESTNSETVRYKITGRGIAHLHNLLSRPLPERGWISPDSKQET